MYKKINAWKIVRQVCQVCQILLKKEKFFGSVLFF
jgi:hypothetical protein